jgi:hypothetical protein
LRLRNHAESRNDDPDDHQAFDRLHCSGHKPSFGSQPIANNACSLLVILRPSFREAVIGNFVALDAERGLNEPGGMIGVVGIDRLLQQIGHGVYSSLMTSVRLQPA